MHEGEHPRGHGGDRHARHVLHLQPQCFCVQDAIAGLQGLGAPSPTPSVGGGPAEECEQSSNGQGTIPWITT